MATHTKEKEYKFVPKPEPCPKCADMERENIKLRGEIEALKGALHTAETQYAAATSMPAEPNTEER